MIGAQGAAHTQLHELANEDFMIQQESIGRWEYVRRVHKTLHMERPAVSVRYGISASESHQVTTEHESASQRAKISR